MTTRKPGPDRFYFYIAMLFAAISTLLLISNVVTINMMLDLLHENRVLNSIAHHTAGAMVRTMEIAFGKEH